METQSLKRIPIKDIEPDGAQPRNLIYSIDEMLAKVQDGDKRAQTIWEHLSSLATSILEVGLQQPITVYPDGKKYKIYDGHRRWLAMQILDRQGQSGDGKMLCYVRPQVELEQEALLGQLNLNIQREGFNVFELARSLRHVYANLRQNGGSVRIVREDGGIDTVEVNADTSDKEVWDTIERMVGISSSRRYQIAAVLKLPEHIQALAEEKGIPESVLRYLIPVKDEALQERIINEILTQNLSNAEIRKRIQAMLDEVAKQPAPAAMPTPIQIESALKPLQQLVKEIDLVGNNVPGAISAKDPRTVARYKKVLPELRVSKENIQRILDRLTFLEED